MNYEIQALLRTAPGSVGETAKTYANSYARINKVATRDKQQFDTAFKQVILFRVLAYEKFSVDDKNLLQPFKENILQPIYSFFDEIEEQMKNNISAFEYTDNRPVFQVDLPTMALYTMLLESNNKRMGFAGADEDFMFEALKVIHQEAKAECAYQSFFTEADFIEENMMKLKLFLFNVDQSLAYLIRGSRK